MISRSLQSIADTAPYWPSGRKVRRLAAMESWFRRCSQQSWRGTWLRRLWSTVRFCRERQRWRRSGRDISWFIAKSRVSRSCRSPISEWKIINISWGSINIRRTEWLFGTLKFKTKYTLKTKDYTKNLLRPIIAIYSTWECTITAED